MPSVKCLEDINVPFLAELRTVAERGNLHKGIGQSLEVLNTNGTKLKWSSLTSAFWLCLLILPNSCLAVGNHKECKELGLVFFNGACYKREEICPDIYTWFDDRNATDPCQPCHPGLCNPYHSHICTHYIYECDSNATTSSPPPANISTTMNPNSVGTKSATESSTLQTSTVPTTISSSTTTQAPDATTPTSTKSPTTTGPSIVLIVALVIILLLGVALLIYCCRKEILNFFCPKFSSPKVVYKPPINQACFSYQS